MLLSTKDIEIKIEKSVNSNDICGHMYCMELGNIFNI